MKIIVAGTNDVALNITDVLSHQYNVVLIGPDTAGANKLSTEENIKYYHSTSVDQDSLLEAGVAEAQVFVASTLNDERNLIACLNARAIRPKSYDNENPLSIVCLLNRPNLSGITDFNESLIGSLDIDSIIHPSDELAQEIVQIAEVQGALDVQVFEQGNVYLVRVRIESEATLVGRKVRHLPLPPNLILVLAKKKEGDIFIPNGESVFYEDDTITVMGFLDDIETFLYEMAFREDYRTLPKIVTVVGGGTVGKNVANLLAQANWDVRVIEQKIEIIDEVCTENNPIYFRGDGTDIDFLSKCRVEESSLLIAVTNSDERNLLVSLLGQYIGVERIITRADRLSNEKIFEEIGIDVVRSARGAAIRKVVHQLIEDKPVRTELEHGDFQLIEMIVPQHFSTKKVLDLPQDRPFVIGTIIREHDVIIPSGSTDLRPKDKLLVVVGEKVAEDVRYILTGERTEG
jgi:trk system potassium uptake protein